MSPGATPRASGLSAFLSSFFLSFAVENQKASAENTARSQEPKILSTFYHFLLFTAICIRVVRKTPIAEGSRLNGKSISIIHFQPEFHTLEALDIILGNQEGNSCGAGHTPQDFSLLIQGVPPHHTPPPPPHPRAEICWIVRSLPGAGAGKPGKKSDLCSPLGQQPPPPHRATCREKGKGL